MEANSRGAFATGRPVNSPAAWRDRTAVLPQTSPLAVPSLSLVVTCMTSRPFRLGVPVGAPRLEPGRPGVSLVDVMRELGLRTQAAGGEDAGPGSVGDGVPTAAAEDRRAADRDRRA